MNDKIVFGQYINSNSWIHKLDPRTKIITLFTLMIGVFLINNVYALLICLAFNFLIVLTSKIPLNKFLNSFKMIAMLLIFTTFFQIVFNTTGDIVSIKDHPLDFNLTLTGVNLILSLVLIVIYYLLVKYIRKFKIILFLILLASIFCTQLYINDTLVIVNYNIAVHEGGLITSVLVLLRIINLISLSALLTFTTKPTDLNGGIESLFKPFKFMKRGVSIMAMMISIALRFIPTLLNESQKILKAQASRGVDFNDGKLKEKIIQLVSLLVPMFVTSYKKAEDLANAMEARGYIPGEDRTRIYELKYNISDILTYIFLILFITALVILKIKRVV